MGFFLSLLFSTAVFANDQCRFFIKTDRDVFYGYLSNHNRAFQNSTDPQEPRLEWALDSMVDSYNRSMQLALDDLLSSYTLLMEQSKNESKLEGAELNQVKADLFKAEQKLSKLLGLDSGELLYVENGGRNDAKNRLADLFRQGGHPKLDPLLVAKKSLTAFSPEFKALSFFLSDSEKWVKKLKDEVSILFETTPDQTPFFLYYRQKKISIINSEPTKESLLPLEVRLELYRDHIESSFKNRENFYGSLLKEVEDRQAASSSMTFAEQIKPLQTELLEALEQVHAFILEHQKTHVSLLEEVYARDKTAWIETYYENIFNELEGLRKKILDVVRDGRVIENDLMERVADSLKE